MIQTDDYRTRALSRGMPKKLFDRIIIPGRIIPMAREYSANFQENIERGQCLAFHGPTGNDKSQSQAWIIKENKYKWFQWLMPAQLVSYAFDEEKWDWICETCNLVVVDDFCEITVNQDKDRQWSIMKMGEFITRRLDVACKATFFSWMGGLQAPALWGDHVVRRILESCGKFIREVKK